MSMNEAEKLRATLSSIFNRKGHDGRYTRLFENLGSPHKDILLSKVQLSDGELPVIGSVENENQWVIITTERIVWQSGDKDQSLPVQDVHDVIADFRKLVATGRRKDQMRELQILSKNGEQYMLGLEEGAPLMGVWNALKHLGARNQQKK